MLLHGYSAHLVSRLIRGCRCLVIIACHRPRFAFCCHGCLHRSSMLLWVRALCSTVFRARFVCWTRQRGHLSMSVDLRCAFNMIQKYFCCSAQSLTPVLLLRQYAPHWDRNLIETSSSFSHCRRLFYLSRLEGRSTSWSCNATTQGPSHFQVDYGLRFALPRRRHSFGWFPCQYRRFLE